jgi:hypothetical protein
MSEAQRIVDETEKFKVEPTAVSSPISEKAAANFG